MKKLTQKKRKEMCRQIIDRNLFDVEFDAVDVAEFSSVTGLDAVRVVRRRNPSYPSDKRHLHAVKSGECEFAPISWINAISPPGEKTEVIKAMRDHIQCDLDEFRMSVSPAVCEVCGTDKDITTDHIDPPFKKICEMFFDLHGIPETKDGPPGAGDVFSDADMLEKWIVFHTENATYQILCRSHNSQKGAR